MANVLFYSRKGGQGKTTHAISYAHWCKGIYYTNDYGNATIETYQGLFEEGKLKELKQGGEIEYDDSTSNIYDFGGFLDNRLIPVAKFVDFCVVPIYYQSKADLTPSAQTIIELGKYNKNIVILINNTEKEYIDTLQKALKDRFDYPVFIISRSKYIVRLADENKTLFNLFDEGGLNKYQLRKLLPQIKEFYNHLGK